MLIVSCSGEPPPAFLLLPYEAWDELPTDPRGESAADEPPPPRGDRTDPFEWNDRGDAMPLPMVGTSRGEGARRIIVDADLLPTVLDMAAASLLLFSGPILDYYCCCWLSFPTTICNAISPLCEEFWFGLAITT